MYSPKETHWGPGLQHLRTWLYLETGSLQRYQVPMRSCRLALNQYYRRPCEKGTLVQRATHRAKTAGRHTEEMAIDKQG